MSVIVELTVPAQEFELGRVLHMEGDAAIRLETMVPFGERSIPFFRIVGERESFEAAVRDHPAVKEIHVVTSYDGEVLYALDWAVSEDAFFRGLVAMNASILDGTGTARQWAFDLRFRTHEALSDFQAHCEDNEISITIKRIYNPTTPDAGPWYGLTPAQRNVLTLAVKEGYYSIPRECSTQELATHFDISDQSVSERLRRGIDSLVSSTLLASEPEEAEKSPETDSAWRAMIETVATAQDAGFGCLPAFGGLVAVNDHQLSRPVLSSLRLGRQ